MRESNAAATPDSPTDSVRSSARAITALAGSGVGLNISACHAAAAFLVRLNSTNPRTPSSIASSWLGANGLHPPAPDVSALSWIFVVDTLNFCFWGPLGGPRWSVSHNGKTYEGYWALCASINRALEEGIPMTDPAFYAKVSCSQLTHIFRSANSVPVPMLESRVKVLNEAGTVLTKSFNSSVEDLVAAANGSADNLIGLLVRNFSSFNDSVLASAGTNDHVKSTHRLFFYKRAQIFVADVWACFAATNKYPLHDIGNLTMFADYRVPQALAWLGAIEYSPKVLQALASGEELAHGDPREIQIRGFSIHAVEIIRQEMERLTNQQLGQTARSKESAPINSVMIDFALWDYATEHRGQLAKFPIHRTKSVYY